MISRLDTLMVNGHIIDKLEIIIEGGTYTEYPAKYLEEYNRDLFYAANIYFDLKRVIIRVPSIPLYFNYLFRGC